MRMGEEFRPSIRMKPLFYTYLSLIMVPLYLAGFLILSYIYSLQEYSAALLFVLFYLLPITAAAVFTLYWIPKYYSSIKYVLTEGEVRIEQGVWWKRRRAVPFSRVMAVETIQGPISRHFGIGTVDIYTAGYTGPSGSSGGPGSHRSEATIIHVPDFIQLRDDVLNIVRGKPLFGAPAQGAEDVGPKILEELREIRKLLQR